MKSKITWLRISYWTAAIIGWVEFSIVFLPFNRLIPVFTGNRANRNTSLEYICQQIKEVMKENFDSKHNVVGYGFKSKTTFLGLPFLHISFQYRKNGVPIPAMGIISIGQFGAGIINISQFGIGVVSLSQFTIAGYALAQVAVAYSCVAQVGIYIDQGYGQVVRSLAEVLAAIF